MWISLCLEKQEKFANLNPTSRVSPSVSVSQSSLSPARLLPKIYSGPIQLTFDPANLHTCAPTKRRLYSMSFFAHFRSTRRALLRFLRDHVRCKWVPNLSARGVKKVFLDTAYIYSPVVGNFVVTMNLTCRYISYIIQCMAYVLITYKRIERCGITA